MMYSSANRKTLLLLSLVLFLTALTAAEGDYTVEYGDSVTLSADVAQSDQVNEIEFSVCGYTNTKSKTFFWESDDAEFTVDVPEDIQCGPGSYLYTMDVRGSHSHTISGLLTIDSRGGMDRHKGKYMYIGLNSDKEQIHHFFLSNEDYADMSPSPPGVIMTEFNDRAIRSDTYDVASGELTARTGIWITNGVLLEDLIDTCEDGENGACGVDDVEFGTSYDPQFGDQHGFSYIRDTMTPIHDDGEYKLDGDIITGYQPGYYDDDGGYVAPDGPKFFICREGAIMSNGHGEDVPQLVEYFSSSGDSFRYKCMDTDSGYRWKATSACNDGLDNGGDGKIDHADSDYQQNEGNQGVDPNCNTPDDDDENSGGCMNGKAVKEDGEWKAYHPTDDGCAKTPYSDWDVQEPQRDYCERDVNKSELCKSVDYDGFGNDTVPVIKYFAETSFFEQLAQKEGNDASAGIGTKFVNGNGWTSQWQTLHRAEKKYSGTGEDEHSLSTWSDRIRSPEVENAYDNDDPTNNIKAWQGANAGQTSKRVRDSFSGGFAGLCEAGQMWINSQEVSGWACEGALDMDQAILLPDITSGDTIGMAVMPFLVADELPSTISEEEDWQGFGPAVAGNDDWSSSNEITGMNATCWPGKQEDKEQQLENNNFIREENTDVSGTEPFGLYGEVGTTGFGTFTCNWGFHTSESIPEGVDEGDGLVRNVGNLHQIRQDPEKDEYSGFVDTYDIDDGALYSSTDFENWMNNWGIEETN